jgi:hypothetical protein
VELVSLWNAFISETRLSVEPIYLFGTRLFVERTFCGTHSSCFCGTEHGPKILKGYLEEEDTPDAVVDEEVVK